MAASIAASSLEIRFGDGVTKARLHCSGGYEQDLRRLALRFRSSVQRAPGTMEVEIDALLTNLVALATWPNPASVSWDSQLAALATDSAMDAQAVAEHLDQATAAANAVQPGHVDELLGPGWIAGLTAFQRRDIARLLSLRHGANFSVPGADRGRPRINCASKSRSVWRSSRGKPTARLTR